VIGSHETRGRHRIGAEWVRSCNVLGQRQKTVVMLDRARPRARWSQLKWLTCHTSRKSGLETQSPDHGQVVLTRRGPNYFCSRREMSGPLRPKPHRGRQKSKSLAVGYRAGAAAGRSGYHRGGGAMPPPAKSKVRGLRIRIDKPIDTAIGCRGIDCCRTRGGPHFRRLGRITEKALHVEQVFRRKMDCREDSFPCLLRCRFHSELASNAAIHSSVKLLTR